jgi:hypothetical protein
VSRFGRLLTTTALCVPMVLAGPAGAASGSPPSSTATSGTTCSGQAGISTIKPGVATKTQSVKIVTTMTFTNCVGGGVTGGTAKTSIVDSTANCTGLAKLGLKFAIAETITWNTGQASTFKGTATTGPKLLQATIAGSVIAGLFKGLKVSTVVTYFLTKGNCVKTALTSLTVAGVKPFVV